VWLPALIVLPLVVAVGMVAARTAGQGCSTPQTVEVVAAPDIASGLKKAGSAWARSAGSDGCTDVRVSARSSAEMVARLGRSGVEPPDVWVPDSSEWVQKLRRDISGKATPAQSLWVLPSIASSPLVLAASPDDARSLVKTAAGGWSRVLSGRTSLAVADPFTSTEGILTVAAAQAALGRPSGTPTRSLVSGFVALSTHVVSDISQALKSSSASLPFPASEQDVIRANAGPGSDKLQAVYPRDVGRSLDFPVVEFAPAEQPPLLGAAVRAYVHSLYRPHTQRLLREAGLRDAKGGAFASTVDFHGVAPTAVIRPLPTLSDRQMTDALRVWSAANRRNRTLIVVDVSGSMVGDKIRFAAAAAAEAADYLPDDAQLGLWAFSTSLNGSSPWRQLVSLGRIGSPSDPHARRQALRSATDELPRLAATRGNTDLYRTTWDAFSAVRKGYDPQSYNSVVLVTDGANNTSGLTRETLLSRLRSARTPSRPLPVFTVAIGPDADRKTLKRISAATAGAEYDVDSAANIREVFLDAVIKEGT
jgi:Mg-chelatase subunit ChlD